MRKMKVRKFAFEKKTRNKFYSNELRQAVANRVDYYLTTTNSSIDSIWRRVGKEFDISWGSARNYHNALGNAPSARKRNSNAPNVEPISKSRYSNELRYVVLKTVMESNMSIPVVAKSLNISNSTIYDWVKAYGWSTAYFSK